MALQLASAPPFETIPTGARQGSIRVALADDQSRVRRGLRLLLDREAQIEVIVDGDATRSLGQVASERPDVMVLDLQLSGGASLAAIKQLRDQLPGTEIVVLTIERNPVFAQRVLDAGAIGYVLKGSAEAELPEAVRLAAFGFGYISPPVAAGIDALRNGERGDGISPRETEVLRLIAFGYTSAEIAGELHVSRRTVDSHRASIHRKLGLHTRADLVQFALARGLLGN